MRKAAVTRTTKETDVAVAVDLDGAATRRFRTGIGFLDHMLDLLGATCAHRHHRERHGRPAYRPPPHHRGRGHRARPGVKQALGDMRGITRYADVHVPMDETLTRVALDISGRPFLRVQGDRFRRDKVGIFDTELVQRMVPGIRRECRRHPACRNAVRQQRPSYR